MAPKRRYCQHTPPGGRIRRQENVSKTSDLKHNLRLRLLSATKRATFRQQDGAVDAPQQGCIESVPVWALHVPVAGRK
jgi:hypothetical protein